MKIAVFENEYDSVKGAFEAAKLLDFNSELQIEVFPSSQKADFGQIGNFSTIFVDIDLSSKSELDGFSLIQKIKSIDEKLLSRIVILTGNNRIEENLKERELFSKLIQIIIKPTNYEEISKAIRKCGGK
jgi:DNA-binding LytR/AlgR family response regulator